MRAVRYKHDGRLVWWDAPDLDGEIDFDKLPVRDEEIPDGAELIYIDCTPEEFEQQLIADCGRRDFGVCYLNDDVTVETAISRAHGASKRGKKMRDRRVRSYEPESELNTYLQRKGKSLNDAVTFDDLKELLEYE